MITMPLERLTHAEVETHVAELCSQYGTVKRIVVVPGVRPYCAIASVEMSCAEETRDIMRRFGDMRTGKSVVITIESVKSVSDSLNDA